MNLIIILLVIIAVLVWKVVSQHKMLGDSTPSAGIPIEKCPVGKYQVLGKIVIDDEDLGVPSNLRKYYTLVFPCNWGLSKMFLLKSHDPLTQHEGIVTV